MPMELPAWLLRPKVLLTGFFFLRFALWYFVEKKYRLYPNDLRRTLLGDLVTTVVLGFVIIPLSDKLAYRVPAFWWLGAHVDHWPATVRILLYLVLADLGHYWMHRLIHQRWLWPMHRWHHSPTHMSWLAGNRESLPDRLLTSLPYFLFWPIVNALPAWTSVALLAFASVKNDWMHLNVRVPFSRQLEWLFVTPRFHHVHHSDDPTQYGKNIGVLFSVWDRMFGTYVEPKEPAKSFGTGEKVPLYRLFLGV